MTKRFTGALFLIALIISGLDCRPAELAPARENTTAFAVLESILERFARVNEGMQKQAAALLALVDTEAAGKRVSDAMADSLRATARKIDSPDMGDARTLLANTHLPIGNEALIREIHEVEKDAIAAQAKREALISEAVVETRRQTHEIGFHAKKSAEIDPLIALVARLKTEVIAHSAPEESTYALQTLHPCEVYLQGVTRFLGALERHDADAAPAALTQWLDSALNTGAVSFTDRQAFLYGSMAGLESAKEQAGHKVEAALDQRKPRAEIEAAIQEVEAVTDFYNRVLPHTFVRSISPASYRKMAAIEAALGKPCTRKVGETIGEARQEVQWLAWQDEPGQYRLRVILAGWEQDFARTQRKYENDARESIAAKIRSVKRPAELMALSQDLERRSAEDGPADSDDDARGWKGALRTMANRCAGLAGIWESGSLSLLGANFSGQPGEGYPPLDRAWGALRERIERDALGRALRAPELGEPPLVDQPLNAALESLRDGFASKGEWARVLRVLLIRASPREYSAGLSTNRAAAASVRAFLAGQNFELAEQWVEAASAYKGVLRTAAEGTPVKEAAERLKALKEEHSLPAP